MHMILGYGLAFCVGAMATYALFRRRLKEQKTLLNQWMDGTIEGIFLSQGGIITHCNRQALEMFHSDDRFKIIGKPLVDFIAPESLALVKENMQKNFPSSYECVLTRFDQTDFPVIIHGVMLDLKTRLSAMIDISELKKTQDALHALNETLEKKVAQQLQTNRQQEAMLFQQSRHAQMGEMISMIAHQWRQPLNVLSLLSQNLVFKYQQNKLDAELMKEFKTDSMRQIVQMSKTIDDFRDFFKPEKFKKIFDVKKQLEHIVEMIRPILTSHGIELNFELIEGMRIESFPNEFTQSIISLLNNAKDVLMEKNDVSKKWICLRMIRLEQGLIGIEVTDNGGGILEKHLDKIFQPYFSTKTEKNGTGLGLYMTRMIIEEHMKGTIRVHNAQEGACFMITLQGLNDGY